MGGFGQRSNPALRTFGFPSTFGGVASFRGRIIALRPAWTNSIPSAETHRIEMPHDHRPSGEVMQRAPEVVAPMASAELANQALTGSLFTSPPQSLGETFVATHSGRSGQAAPEASGSIGLPRGASHDARTVEPIDSRPTLARPRNVPGHSKG